MTSTDLARTDDAQRGLAVADREEAAGARRAFPVTLVCEGCEQPFVAVLWYRTQRRAYCSDLCRDTVRSDRRAPMAERFWPKVNKNGAIPPHRPDLGPCWLWLGSTNRGYGTIYSGTRTDGGDNLPALAHRVSYELVSGPIPEGVTIDHLCRVTACVNPSHLELVTMAVNILRSNGISARHARAAECQRGHEKTEANVYRYPDGRTECRPCRQMRMAAFATKRSAS